MKLDLSHAADLQVACPRCNAAPGVECSRTNPGIVHFHRRLANLARDPEAYAMIRIALDEHEGEA